MNPTDSITLPPPVLEVTPPPPGKGEREYRAFQRLLPELRQNYRGKYVAIHDEVVVDSDDDDIALILRINQRVGNVALYVGLVTDSDVPLLRIPHYRLYRPGGEG